MNPAASVSEHDAFVVRFLDQGKAVPVAPEARGPGDEIGRRHAEKTRDRGDIALIDTHVPWPFAAGGTPLADVVDPGLEHRVVVARAAMGGTASAFLNHCRR